MFLKGKNMKVKWIKWLRGRKEKKKADKNIKFRKSLIKFNKINWKKFDQICYLNKLK